MTHKKPLHMIVDFLKTAPETTPVLIKVSSSIWVAPQGTTVGLQLIPPPLKWKLTFEKLMGGGINSGGN